VRDARSAAASHPDSALSTLARTEGALTPYAIAGAAKDGDPLALELVQRSARLVGESIAEMVNIFNPSVIIIGGAVAWAGELFLADVRQRIYERALPLATRDLQIVRSIGDPNEPLLGAAELVREQLFETTFASWFAQGHPDGVDAD
jgi:predicted NBD/HSP70 family sugar kinase